MMASVTGKVKSVTCKVILDVSLVIIVLAVIAVFELHGFTPFHRGFFCNDENIQYPLTEQTFGSVVIFLTASTVPIAAILFCEFLIAIHNKKRFNVQEESNPSKPGDVTYTLCGRRQHSYIVSVYKHAGAFIFSAAIAQAACDITKSCIGRLRPHFLAACDPDWSGINCTDSQGRYTYVTDYTCKNDDYWVLVESRLSFPSGHATFSCACFVYLILYLQFRMTWRGSRLLKHFLQAVIVYFTIYVCSTRVSNYYHFVGDVLAGAFIGTTVAVLMACFVTDLCPSVRSHKVLRRVQIDVNDMFHNYSRTNSTATCETGYDSTFQMEDVVSM